MASDKRPRLSRDAKKKLRDLGWKYLNRKKAQRPDEIAGDKLLGIDEEAASEVPLVKLEQYQ